MTQTEALQAFADALATAGLRVKGPPVMDGKIHRSPVDGDRGRKMSGSYVGHLDNVPAGYIHNFKAGAEIRWVGVVEDASAPARMTQVDRDGLRRQQEEARQARDQERREKEGRVAEAAERAWREARPAPNSHPYLVRKGVRAHGMRQGRPGQKVPMADKEIGIAGRLLVPLRDADGKLWNLQMIDAKGNKLFLPGRKQGLFATLGPLRDTDPIVLAEGFATAATMRQATHLTSVVAFDSGNLMPVTMAIASRFTGSELIIAADNDHHLPRRNPPLPNVGLEKAKEAAAATNAGLLVPSFRPDDQGSDWNDAVSQLGEQRVAELIRGVLLDRGIQLPDPG